MTASCCPPIHDRIATATACSQVSPRPRPKRRGLLVWLNGRPSSPAASASSPCNSNAAPPPKPSSSTAPNHHARQRVEEANQYAIRDHARDQIFFTEGDYAAFERTLQEALQRPAGAIELFSYIIMPNHFHLDVRPKGDEDVSEFMRWLTVTHTQRYHAFHATSGNGHLYQGRFKSFPAECDDAHFLCVCRYIERNALRAGLVIGPTIGACQACGEESIDVAMECWRSGPWRNQWIGIQTVNSPQTTAEEESLRRCLIKGQPFGSAQFQEWTTELLGLESSFRGRGRPRKNLMENDS
jgi:putative transposase